MKNNLEPKVGRARGVWALLIAAVILLAALSVWRAASMARSMSAAAASDEKQFSEARPGSKTKFVMEIEGAIAEGTIRGKLLEKKTEEIYTRSKTPATVWFSEQTSVVMGKKADIRDGAIVHVSGTVRDDGSIQADQIVILTGYVKVQ